MSKIIKHVNSSDLVYGLDAPEAMTGDLISDRLALILLCVVYSVFCQAFVVFGTAANIINIICFVKQGFADPVNISLLGLAVADLGCLTTLVWTNICYAPGLAALLPFELVELQYLASAWPHFAFTRVSSWITGFITLERCICITAPMKVKSIITPKRVSVLNISVFLILISSVAPVYVVTRLGLKFSPERNRTLFRLIYTSDWESVEKIFYPVYSVFIPFSAFVIIIICTIILVVKLQKMAKWRKTSTTSGQADIISNRNQKVAKMVVMISILFIVCFIPICIVFIAMSLEPKLSMRGRYKNTLVIMGGITLVTESINSSMNIFLYYRMSSRYRNVIRKLLHLDKIMLKLNRHPNKDVAVIVSRDN